MSLDNPDVWVLFPSATQDRALDAYHKWHAQGYKVGIMFDLGKPQLDVDLNVACTYQGYWASCNWLAAEVVKARGADVVIFAADDIEPDPTHTAQVIARQFLDRFSDGFGVMQPCGDRQGIDATGKPAAARICGSPWMGRGWVLRAYQGCGPTWDEYFHFYGDEDLHDVADMLGVLWMREDLTQLHRHWSWGHAPQAPYQKRNSDRHWAKDKALFEKHKREGFQNHQPLPWQDEVCAACGGRLDPHLPQGPHRALCAGCLESRIG